MKIIIGSEKEIMKAAAKRYEALLKEKPNAILGLATGSTPLGLYSELASLCSEGKISFSKAKSFNLDEYVGLLPTHDQSYRYFMNTNLFEHIDIPIEETHVPSGFVKSNEEAEAYDEEIKKAGGIDLQLLGIGHNGHIAFNEPKTPLGSHTHIVTLTDSTRKANARFFSSIDEVPTHAVSMGIETIMQAKSIILIALGKGKAPIIKETIEGEVSDNNPASILRLHPDVTFYLDNDAASLLK